MPKDKLYPDTNQAQIVHFFRSLWSRAPSNQKTKRTFPKVASHALIQTRVRYGIFPLLGLLELAAFC
jgi:hypothetical protein